MIPCQSLDAAVVGGLRLLGEEAAGDAFIVVPVVGHTFTALSMPRAVISTGAVALVVTVLCHIHSPFFFQTVSKHQKIAPRPYPPEEEAASAPLPVSSQGFPSRSRARACNQVTPVSRVPICRPTRGGPEISPVPKISMRTRLSIAVPGNASLSHLN